MTGYFIENECTRNNNTKLIPDTTMPLTTIILVSLGLSSTILMCILFKNPIAAYYGIILFICFIAIITTQVPDTLEDDIDDIDDNEDETDNDKTD
jgi:hypothetical protein